jgi:hypothetical protein
VITHKVKLKSKFNNFDIFNPKYYFISHQEEDQGKSAPDLDWCTIRPRCHRLIVLRTLLRRLCSRFRFRLGLMGM